MDAFIWSSFRIIVIALGVRKTLVCQFFYLEKLQAISTKCRPEIRDHDDDNDDDVPK